MRLAKQESILNVSDTFFQCKNVFVKSIRRQAMAVYHWYQYKLFNMSKKNVQRCCMKQGLKVGCEKVTIKLNN